MRIRLLAGGPWRLTAQADFFPSVVVYSISSWRIAFHLSNLLRGVFVS